MEEPEVRRIYSNYEIAKDAGVSTGDWITQQASELPRQLRALAEQGNLEAIHLMSLCYAYGHGVANDWAECFDWTLKSAQGGVVSGMCNTGLMYLKGQGVQQSYREAKRWLQEAANLGDATAMTLLGDMMRRGQCFEKDIDAAVAMLRKAGGKGEPTAQYMLTALYLGGDVIEQDVSQAVYWSARAIAQGHKPTRELLAEFGVELDQEKARSILAEQETEEAVLDEQLQALASQFTLGLTQLGAEMFSALIDEDQEDE